MQTLDTDISKNNRPCKVLPTLFGFVQEQKGTKGRGTGTALFPFFCNLNQIF